MGQTPPLTGHSKNDMNEITRVLAGVQRGDSSADPQLLTLGDAELRHLARAKMARE